MNYLELGIHVAFLVISIYLYLLVNNIVKPRDERQQERIDNIKNGLGKWISPLLIILAGISFIIVMLNLLNA